jgi:hypothetical protein
MKLLFLVLAFLLPVVLVFGYSIWLNRRRRTSGAVNSVGDPENTTFSALVERCKALKNSAIADNDADIDGEIESVLAIARSLQDQDLRELSLSHVMGVYVTIGRDEEARALLSEVKKEANRASILEKVFGNVT